MNTLRFYEDENDYILVFENPSETDKEKIKKFVATMLFSTQDLTPITPEPVPYRKERNDSSFEREQEVKAFVKEKKHVSVSNTDRWKLIEEQLCVPPVKAGIYIFKSLLNPNVNVNTKNLTAKELVKYYDRLTAGEFIVSPKMRLPDKIKNMGHAGQVVIFLHVVGRYLAEQQCNPTDGVIELYHLLHYSGDNIVELFHNANFQENGNFRFVLPKEELSEFL